MRENTTTVWVASIEVELSRLVGKRTIAIVMNASNFDEASDIDFDHFITNVASSTATTE